MTSAVVAADPARPGEQARAPAAASSSFDARFTALFDAGFARLHRVLDRLSGDPDLAADIAQETFIRLYARGSLPDSPDAWLISVAMNLLRNAMTSRKRRERLLSLVRGERLHSDPAPAAEDSALAEDARARVRRALDRLPERERQMLLLRVEGYEYREIALALGVNEASVGVMLARAKRAFRDRYEEASHARR